MGEQLPLVKMESLMQQVASLIRILRYLTAGLAIPVMSLNESFGILSPLLAGGSANSNATRSIITSVVFACTTAWTIVLTFPFTFLARATDVTIRPILDWATTCHREDRFSEFSFL